MMTAAMCLALNIFFEARAEPLMGQLMVAEVTLNRVEDKRFPDTVCEVVYQRKQFSWTHDGKSDKPSKYPYLDRKLWPEIKQLAKDIIDGKIDMPRNGATHYHATYVEPAWADSLEVVGRVGQHIFYTWD